MNLNTTKKTILIAPLNWGLGHATRCIPIIKELEKNNFIPILASDGAALELLQQEFPHLKTLELPSYRIEYAKNGRNFKWKMLQNIPKIAIAIWKERKLIEEWVNQYKIDGIISDNRLGVFNKSVPTVYITHQLNVLSGASSIFSSQIHQHFIKKHKVCWVPDMEGFNNLAGILSRPKKKSFEVNYIGPLSRMQKKQLPIVFDLMIILSGPEPQREILQEKLIIELQKYKGKVVFVKGLMEKFQKKEELNNITFYNFMNSELLEKTINESAIILCRSGYTSIMDLAKLEKKAFFIPTPGQNEQEYLAEKLQKEGFVPYSTQESFNIENLSEVSFFKGLPNFDKTIDWPSLFEVFDKK
ncbi:glycosyltransferase [Flavobacterium sp. K5-23]|uniref:glycosyltransferase n=1 Tax=Flavobacterium sp. K5-23 TaxID=2746225 RepID=UPI0020106690|nr:glycosyltransferase [Flavobacterium sp. K5-23]UQD55310.1 glycosyltransferase [Flavobacterium sp. K5-23]